MRQNTDGKRSYVRFTPEELKWIERNYPLNRSAKTFYRNYVRKFGRKRSSDSLVGQAKRMKIGVDSDYYPLTELAKLFGFTRTAVREHLKSVGIKFKTMRGRLYILDADIDRAFRALEKKESELKPDGWMPIAQASDILGVSQRTVRWAVSKGYLHPQQKRMRFYFDPKEINRIVNLLKKTESPQILWSKWCKDIVYLSERGK